MKDRGRFLFGAGGVLAGEEASRYGGSNILSMLLTRGAKTIRNLKADARVSEVGIHNDPRTLT